MIKLKDDNVKKCFSLLREFIEGTQSLNNKKEIAVLALNQLQRITAGTTPDLTCNDTPRADASSGDSDPYLTCNDTPRADGISDPIGG